MRPKLQALLADRFQLRFHRETREQPVYVLVVGIETLARRVRRRTRLQYRLEEGSVKNEMSRIR